MENQEIHPETNPVLQYMNVLFGTNNDYALGIKLEDINQNDIRDWNWRDQIDYNGLERP